MQVNTTDRSSLDSGGFAPDVLRTSLYFVEQSSDFDTALDPSLTFAGAANYCPVLVGALAGARYGASTISLHHLNSNKMINADLVARISKVADDLAAGWE